MTTTTDTRDEIASLRAELARETDRTDYLRGKLRERNAQFEKLVKFAIECDRELDRQKKILGWLQTPGVEIAVERERIQAVGLGRGDRVAIHEEKVTESVEIFGEELALAIGTIGDPTALAGEGHEASDVDERGLEVRVMTSAQPDFLGSGERAVRVIQRIQGEG